MCDLPFGEVASPTDRDSYLLLSTPEWGIAMNTLPTVQFFTGRSELFARDGRRWRRLTPEDDAHGFTGFNCETRETNVGVYVTKRPNALLRIGFDLWKLSANLQPAVTARLERRWTREASTFSKPLQRSASRSAHFSKSFVRFEIAPERVEEWKAELSAVLSNPESYEQL
jgi:hypothetical protein